MNIKDRVALVTGSARGIGEGIIRRFAEHGAKVIVNDLNQEQVDKVVEDINNQGGTAFGIAADITNRALIEDMFAKVVEKYGKIDIVINNAGIERDRSIRKMTEEDWDVVLDVNLKGPFLICKYASQYMRDQKYGRIVNIASRAWLGWFAQANYSASKGGLVSLTRSLAIELGKYGITVNCIAPGIIETDLFKKLPDDVKERLMQAQPSGKVGSPADIAWVAHFLCSEEARYITGQVIYVCGGKSLYAAPSVS